MMKRFFDIRPGEITKAFVACCVTGILTLMIWEPSRTGHEAMSIQFPQQTPDLQSLQLALSSYFQDHEENDMVHQNGVTLQTLDDEGYLQHGSSIRLLPARWRLFPQILEASVSTPESVLVEARLPSGEHLVLLADGSVQSGPGINH
jgi:hypothetical protein